MTPRTSASQPPDSTGPGGPFDDWVDFERTQTQLMHRLFGTSVEAPTLGRFEVTGTAGAGAMGRVYIARDPELDRIVAIKLVRHLDADPEQTERLRDRLAREARALARVTHTNVIGVYEVGRREGELFIVMEYVRGPTLRAWLGERPRSRREILSVVRGAARGLAAAHEAGLVHRDFKPDNVAVGVGNRAVVLDFGLARSVDAFDPDDALDTGPTLVSGALHSVTRTGVAAGTPAYMAPEQLRGDSPDARSDQFAWCVTAWEALTGARPFEDDAPGGTLVRRDTAQPLPRIRRCLERGLALEPDDRWPTMQALSTALDQAEGPRHGRRWAAIATVSLVGVGVIAGYLRYDEARAVARCERTGNAIDDVWNEGVRQEMEDALAATELSYAPAAVANVTPRLSEYADAWRQARIEVCSRVRLTGTWDPEVAEPAQACLDERRLALASLLDELGRPDAQTVQAAVEAAAGLPRMGPCLDAHQLSLAPPPPDIDDRARVMDVREVLSRVAALDAAGKHAPALELATSALRDAEAIGWSPLVASARRWEGAMLEQTGEHAAAETALAAAYFEATRAAAHGVAADAATDLIFTVGLSLARYDEGAQWAEHASVELARLGDADQGLRRAVLAHQLAIVRQEEGAHEAARTLNEEALSIRQSALGETHPEVGRLLDGLATNHLALGEHDEAMELHGRGLAIKRSSLGAEHPSVARSLNNMANVAQATGALAKARTLREEAIAILLSAYGPDHPAVAAAAMNLAQLLGMLGEYEEAAVQQQRALESLEASLGPSHPNVGIALAALAQIRGAAGDFEQARRLYERAIPIVEASLGANHATFGRFLSNLAGIYDALGSTAEARATLERAVTILESTLGPDHPDLAGALNNLGAILEASGELEAARTHCRRALVLRETAFGLDHPAVSSPLVNLASIAVAQGRSAEAIPLVRRALQILEAADAPPSARAPARLVLVRALWSAAPSEGGDPGQTVREAEALRESVEGPLEAEVEAWLSAHPAPPAVP